MGEKNAKEQMKIRAAYGEEIADCAFSAVNTAIGPFFLGVFGIPASLKYLDRFLLTSFQVKACASIVGAVGLGIYTAKRVRIDCEKKVADSYKL